MKKFFKALYSNKLPAYVVLFLQLIILGSGFLWLTDYSKYFFGASTLLSALLVIFEINNSKDSPEFKMTWLALVGVVPVFGALLYIFLHTDFLSGGIASNHKNICRNLAQYIPVDEAAEKNIKENEPHLEGIMNYLKKAADASPYSDTEVKYYDLGEKMYADMKAEMENAKSFIFMEFFIVNFSSSMWIEIFDILCRKVREGVEVRFMYDGIGSLVTLPKNFSAILDNAGIKHTVFAPVQPLLSTYQNNRDHRKIIVIDGRTAFTGGINIADEYVNRIDRFGHWKDNGIRLCGNAVNKLAAMFLEMWQTSLGADNSDIKYMTQINRTGNNSSGYVIPYGDSPKDENKVGKRVYIDFINTARRYVYIMTPYLIPDSEVTEALRYAVDRGVDVRIIIPHHPDKVYAYWLAHTYFPELMKAGIKIYEYTPGFIHAKTVVSDDKKAVVGTINFDYRSFFLHYECAVYLYKTPSVFDIREDFEKTKDESQLITSEVYKKFNPFTKLMGRLIRIVAPLL